MAIALVGHKFAQRPSQLLKIDNERMALDFDMACAIRLRADDVERDAKSAAQGLAGGGGVAGSGGGAPIALDA